MEGALKRRAILGAAIMVCASLPALAADETAATAFPPGADSLVSAITALTNAEEKEIGLWRSSSRFATLREKFIAGLIASKGTSAMTGIAVNYETLLCNPRKDYVELSAKQAYLSATAAELKKTATTAKIDSLTQALVTLFKTNSVKVTNSPDNLKEKQDQALEACKKDFAAYADSYYKYQFGDANAGVEDFLSPFFALFKTIVDVITPVAVAGAKLVDENDRKKAIQGYLSKAVVRKQITAAATLVNADLSAALTRQRYQRVGQFTEQALALASTSFDTSKETSCQAAFDANGLKKRPENARRPTDDFVKCATIGWAVYSDKLAGLLKTGDEYDQLADAPPDLTGRKLKAVTDKLDAIAKGTLPQASFQDLWKTAVEIVGFAQTVVTATSSENRDKIRKQIDALVKAL